MQQLGLTKGAGASDAVAKALKAVDLSSEMVILIDLGETPSVGGPVTPVAAYESPDRVLVRFTVPTPEATLPAVSHPFGILAIPRSEKPVVMEALSDDEMLGTALKGHAALPIPKPSTIPSPRLHTVTGSRITLPGNWFVVNRDDPPDVLGGIVRLRVVGPSVNMHPGPALVIETQPVRSQDRPHNLGGPADVRADRRGPVAGSPAHWYTGEFVDPWLGWVSTRLLAGRLHTTMTRFRFPAGTGTYDHLTLTYPDDSLMEAEALTILDSWQPIP